MPAARPISAESTAKPKGLTGLGSVLTESFSTETSASGGGVGVGVNRSGWTSTGSCIW